MPELPDVETYRRYINSTSLHREIIKIEILIPQLLKDISQSSLKRKLKKKKFLSAVRHGKYLFMQSDEDKYLIFHFGMTGSLKFYKTEKRSPAYAALVIDFVQGYRLAYLCPRKLGKIFFTKGIEKFLATKNLGPDANSIDFKSFKSAVKNSKGTVKSFLMNQKHIAGIGNIYSDEILFKSGFHPSTNTKHFNEDDIKNIFKAMKNILRIAVKAGADMSKMPSVFLLSRRRKNEVCPLCGGKITKANIAGRSSYFCIKHQLKKDKISCPQ